MCWLEAIGLNPLHMTNRSQLAVLAMAHNLLQSFAIHHQHAMLDPVIISSLVIIIIPSTCHARPCKSSKPFARYMASSQYTHNLWVFGGRFVSIDPL
jgi:hypothetical protein